MTLTAPPAIAVVHCDAPEVCSICDHAQLRPVGSKDFGVSGGDYFEKRRLFPNYDVQIAYYECQHCHFVFTNAFDQWSKADFEAHIYNDDYLIADQPFLWERPMRNAQLVAGMYFREREEIDILDFGGGNGTFAGALTTLGFKAETCDLFYENNLFGSQRVFDLITSFEVIEHVPHRGQHAWMAALAALLKPHPAARVLISTELIQQRGTCDWWYVCPRNGHVSIHSTASLTVLAASAGLQLFSMNGSMHFLAPSP